MREISWDRMDQFNVGAARASFTPMEALMSAAPFEPIESSQMEMLALRDVLQDALDDVLTPLELWVFNALVVERKSLRSLGRQINRPKTTIARIRDGAFRKLREHLQDTPAIRSYLERDQA